MCRSDCVDLSYRLRSPHRLKTPDTCACSYRRKQIPMGAAHSDRVRTPADATVDAGALRVGDACSRLAAERLFWIDNADVAGLRFAMFDCLGHVVGKGEPSALPNKQSRDNQYKSGGDAALGSVVASGN